MPESVLERHSSTYVRKLSLCAAYTAAGPRYRSSRAALPAAQGPPLAGLGDQPPTRSQSISRGEPTTHAAGRSSASHESAYV